MQTLRENSQPSYSDVRSSTHTCMEGHIVVETDLQTIGDDQHEESHHSPSQVVESTPLTETV